MFNIISRLFKRAPTPNYKTMIVGSSHNYQDNNWYHSVDAETILTLGVDIRDIDNYILDKLIICLTVEKSNREWLTKH